MLAMPRYWWHSVMYSGTEPTVAVNLWCEDRLIIWRAWSNAIRRTLSKAGRQHDESERPSMDPNEAQAGYSRVSTGALAVLRRTVPSLTAERLNDLHFFNRHGGRDVDYGWSDPRCAFRI